MVFLSPLTSISPAGCRKLDRRPSTLAGHGGLAPSLGQCQNGAPGRGALGKPWELVDIDIDRDR